MRIHGAGSGAQAQGVAITVPSGSLRKGRRLRPATSVLFLLAGLGLCSTVRGGEWKSEGLNCFLRVPDEDGWRITEQPNVAGSAASVTVQNSDGLRRAALLVWRLPHSRVAIDRAFISEFEHGFFRPPLEKLSGRTRAVQGIPAYEAVGIAHEGDKATYNLARVVLANGYAYRLDVAASGVDVTTDEKARRLVEGFGFIQPPQAWVTQDPAAQRKRQTMGVLLFLLGVVVLVFMMRLARRKRARQAK